MLRSCLLLLAAFALTAACARPSADAAPASESAASAAAPAAAGFSLHDLGSTWTDQTGQTVRIADMAGKVQLVALMYTSCVATCPLIVADLKAIEAALPADRRDDVRFVLVSIDPERDTPGRLAEWAAETRLDPARWTLLNGDDGAVRELAATLDVRYQAQPDGEVAHTNGVTVLDRGGVPVHQQTNLGGAAAGVTADVVARLLR